MTINGTVPGTALHPGQSCFFGKWDTQITSGSEKRNAFNNQITKYLRLPKKKE